MVDFVVYVNQSKTVKINLTEDKTLLELKVVVMNVVDLEMTDFNVLLVGFGFVEESLDLTIECLAFGINSE